MEHTSPISLPSGNDPSLLPTVRGWNWGAFCLSWIWACGQDAKIVPASTRSGLVYISIAHSFLRP